MRHTPHGPCPFCDYEGPSPVLASFDHAFVIAPVEQSVFHLHVHLVPRRRGDGLLLPWTSGVTDALRMIEKNEHGESWSAGVAMSALASLREKQGGER